MHEPTALASRCWWREREFWCLIVLTAAIYAPRLTTLTIRGEESRRAVIAREMIERHDWIVPRTQGVVRLSRPPLQNWLIAGLAVWQGGMNDWAVRLPGLAATLLTVAVTYIYARGRLSELGAFLSGLSYASMLLVLELGRTGETEPIFTLTLAAALLAWHGAWSRGAPRSLAWALGGALAGLAMLTKGLQAPLYFFGSTWTYLVLTRQWRALWQPAHLAGLCAFGLVVGVWQAAFIAEMGLADGWEIYFWNVKARFHQESSTTFYAHLATYPFGVVGGCLAPWSVLLLAYLQRDVRARLAPFADTVAFLAISIAVCFPSVWLPPEARPRYFMPLFPCFAVLIGIAVELLAHGATAPRLWTVFVRACGAVMIGAGLYFVVFSAGWPTSRFAPPLTHSVIYAALSGALAACVLRLATTYSAAGMQRAALGIAVFFGLTYTGPVITTQKQRSENLPAAMAALHQNLPAQCRLVSFGHVHHLFLYYFGRPVELHDWPESASDVPEDVEYFCIHMTTPEQPELPFAWQEVAALSVDRNWHAVPKERVIVGRRLSAANDLAQTAEADSRSGL